MIPPKIKEAIEASPELNEQLLGAGMGLDWKKFNRTVFDFLARRINKKVTLIAAAHPSLITEKLIIGKDQYNRLTSDQHITTDESLIKYLLHQKRPFNWVSGKTLHSYWNKGKAKETKLNVLLTYLDISFMDWDDWKGSVISSGLKFSQPKLVRKNVQLDLLRNYFLGSYSLYYQKSDASRLLVKAPFVIGVDDRAQVFAQTLTEGHPYRSSSIELREGILYIHCENQLFDEKENHIFNVGNETNPEVLFGVSNTISVKSKLAIGIRNVLVKQKQPFTETSFIEKEISFDSSGNLTREESIVLQYFLDQQVNILDSAHCCPLSVLEGRLQRPPAQ